MATLLTVSIIILTLMLVFVLVVFVLYINECRNFNKKEIMYQKQVDYYISVLKERHELEGVLLDERTK